MGRGGASQGLGPEDTGDTHEKWSQSRCRELPVAGRVTGDTLGNVGAWRSFCVSGVALSAYGLPALLHAHPSSLGTTPLPSSVCASEKVNG